MPLNQEAQGMNTVSHSTYLSRVVAVLKHAVDDAPNTKGWLNDTGCVVTSSDLFLLLLYLHHGGPQLKAAACYIQLSRLASIQVSLCAGAT